MRSPAFAVRFAPGVLRPALALGFALLAARAGAEDPAPEKPPPPDYAREVRPIFEKYCFSCHAGGRRKGGVELGRFATEEQARGATALFQRIGQRLLNREMPPPSSPQPGLEERLVLKSWLESFEAAPPDCDEIANDANTGFYRGYVMSRRLNRVEYDNSVDAVFGADFRLADSLPSDGAGGEGFDNNGAALFTSSLLVEKYIETANRVVDAILPPADGSGAAVPDPTLPPAEELEAVRARVLAAAPLELLPPRRAASEILSVFARRAFRRSVAPEDVLRYLTLYDGAAARGESFERSLAFALKGVLVSPRFLFLPEPQPDEQGIYELRGYELASRLSYFLWSAPPDEELFEVARSGRLGEDFVLREQTRRMLRDPRSRALAENFAVQWLGIDSLGGAVRPDPDRFPEFDDGLRDAMREEAILLFDRVVKEDRSLLELLDADYTFVNGRLAELYGIPNVSGDGMRLVALPDRARGGVVGMAAVLTATSHSLRTSPVLRGKWVLERILGESVPPPPPDVGALPADDRVADGLTLRERMAAHRANPDCAGCHARMDPIGFGLENFDAIGRWRDTESGKPLDTAGQLPTGESFSTPAQLKDVLLAKKDSIVRHVSKKALGYALGRDLTRYDSCVVDAAEKALRENDYRSSALFETIVSSAPFRMRWGGGN